MGALLPGIIVAFENPKGGVGKSTLTAIFAGYLQTVGKESGLQVGVIDIDDTQNSVGKMRYRNLLVAAQLDEKVTESEEYEIMSISSSDVSAQIDFLKESFDIILIDFPGNLKQEGTIETLHLVDVIIIPFETNDMCLDPTLGFYNSVYTDIIKTRQVNGYNTTVKGLPNRVYPNLKEYKNLIENKDKLPFELLKNHVRDSRVDFQREISTLKDNYKNNAEAFCEEILDLIKQHIEK